MRSLRRLFGGRGQRRVRGDTDAGFIEVPPGEANPLAKSWLEPHLAIAPEAPAARPVLWIFLAGSFGRPTRQTAILRSMAECGHWALNLRYPNDWTINGLARNDPDPAIHEKLRLQVLDGRSRAAKPLLMQPHDSIMARLASALKWLATRHPEGGWNQFVGSAEPHWDRIAAAGHSQGGGHAAILAREITLQRVVMLASPHDLLPNGSPAPWMLDTGMTPMDRYFGFAHTEDHGFAKIDVAWQALEMDRPHGIAQVDGHDAPYGGARALVTSQKVPEGRYHGSVAVDRFTPMGASGEPIYAAVWEYLFSLCKSE